MPDTGVTTMPPAEYDWLREKVMQLGSQLAGVEATVTAMSADVKQLLHRGSTVDRLLVEHAESLKHGVKRFEAIDAATKKLDAEKADANDMESRLVTLESDSRILHGSKVDASYCDEQHVKGRAGITRRDETRTRVMVWALVIAGIGTVFSGISVYVALVVSGVF